jgi:cell division protein FtsB
LDARRVIAPSFAKESQVTETTGSRQSAQTRSRLHRVFTSRQSRWLLVIAILVGIGGYVVGLNIAYLDIAAARQAIQTLRADNQKLKTQISDQNATQVALQNKLTTTEASLEAIVPSKNTYDIKPNQSMIVAGGRLTIGLIGSPTNESVNININGKRQSAATGDVIKIALDPPTTCQVRVQSFDMFRVILAASCAQSQ